jgi:DAK2 domain fusion protein YloV
MEKPMDKVTPLFLKEAFKKGVEVLLLHKDEINALNVFPVPDGDTGSNMSACALEAVRALDKITFVSMKNVTEAIRMGTLMGARGNSGVILSQIFGGFCNTIAKYTEIDFVLFSQALQKGSEVAKSAVMKPVSGTIITLIEDLAYYSGKIAASSVDFVSFFELLTKRAFRLVEKTREMMPKLKQAGVVDAGAKGLAYIVEGFFRYSRGEPVNIQIGGEMNGTVLQPVFEQETLTYQYCTEFMVRLYKGVENGYVDTLKSQLNELGDSLVVVQDSSLLKGHIHTDHPGNIFESVLKYGELIKVKVDNMKDQHESLLSIDASEKKEKRIVLNHTHEIMPDVADSYNENGFLPDRDYLSVPDIPFIDLETGEVELVGEDETKENGFVAISPGEGISRLFKDLNVDQIVPGGQTMNPSTADIAVAIEKTRAKNVFILPNNANIILAAESASRMMSGEKKTVYVVETKSVQEGIAALLGFCEIDNAEQNLENMNSASKEIVSISVTHAVRDSEIENNEIIEGEYLFFANKELVTHGIVLPEVIMSGFEALESDKYHTINIYYGLDIQEEEAQSLKLVIAERYPESEIEVFEGGQPHYPYFISLE